MLIFFDIDGTLLGDRSHIMPESAVRAIAAAEKNGHICAINTGRTKTLVNLDMDKLAGFDAFLMGCGTMITYKEQVLFHRTFSAAESEELIDALYRHGIDAVLEGAENNYHDSYDRMWCKPFENFVRLFEGMGFESFQEARGRFDKFYAYTDDAFRLRAFEEEFEEKLDIVDRERGFYEIMPKGCSKASGMRFLADKLGIPMEQTAAIGDSGNDIPMLQCAHYGIAMGNAAEEVKNIADYVTTDLEEDGVWNALKWLGVI